ncbi:MAG: hypothetical protein IPM36_07455 [Lewinellaceae bacterium]|nr:hypothetical protein [Lewinellaceae bacterium]
MHPPSLFGIRHHGPGSARSMLAALAAAPPDLILIEGPPEGAAMLPLVNDPAMQPPVALLVYNPKNLHQASFSPSRRFRRNGKPSALGSGTTSRCGSWTFRWN